MNTIIKFCLVIIGVMAWHGVTEASPTATRTVCATDCDHITIQSAINAAAPGDTIQLFFLSAHTESDILITKNITIEGLDRDNTIVQADVTPNTAQARVFTVLAGNTVTLQNFTIRHGNPQGNVDGGGLWVRSESGSVSTVTLNEMTIRDNNAANGGGIGNEGVLTLNDVRVQDNTGSIGGGIYNVSGANLLTLTNSSVDNNFASSTGGGIRNSGAMTIDGGSRIFRNVADNGGAILSYATGYTVTIVDTRIDDNELTPTPNDRCGAGLHLRGDVIIRDSEITDNDAKTESGGGLCLSLATVEISRTEISGNSAETGGGILMRSQDSLTMNQVALLENQAAITGGGLVASFQSDVKLTNVTVADNVAGKNGGGIYVNSISLVSIANSTITQNIANYGDTINGNGGGIYIVDNNNNSITLRSTIIAENLVQLDRNGHHDCFGHFSNATYSWIGDLGDSADPCSWQQFSVGMMHSLDPQLGTITGSGYARHYPLLNSSLAIDAGTCLDANGDPLNTDQRGYAMPVDGDGDSNANCDMGSIEYNGIPTAVGLSGQAAGAVAVDSGKWVSWLFVILAVTTLWQLFYIVVTTVS